ncbi:zinc ribbon domain-containing protein [Thermodesulfobacterium hydrogeniphilum]|uniref:zinc ribbon domain-containing protein n=1 Tax=Thermodesulfobacterium hydrogeniphilum TaxID=161156 RepID=UPI00056F995E|nr:zinc ribbon domain-containing protein [Thermodesulfobacterium hydrogeniphilum]
MKIIEFRCCVCGKKFNKFFCTNCSNESCNLKIKCPYCGSNKIVRIVNKVNLFQISSKTYHNHL